MRSSVTERFMRIDARGFHQRQELRLDRHRVAPLMSRYYSYHQPSRTHLSLDKTRRFPCTITRPATARWWPSLNSVAFTIVTYDARPGLSAVHGPLDSLDAEPINAQARSAAMTTRRANHRRDDRAPQSAAVARASSSGSTHHFIVQPGLGEPPVAHDRVG
jgi:hypothetical protein